MKLSLYKLDTTFSWVIEYIFILLSFPPEIISLPFGEKSTVLTGALWIFKIFPNPYISFFQSLIVESLEHDAIKSPVGLIETSFIELVWPINLIDLVKGFKLKVNKFPLTLPVIIWLLY